MTNLNHRDLDVLILGGGFAGVYCAKALEKRLGSGIRAGLVSTENHMVFQPMLPEVVGGAISPRHVVNPLRLLCQKTSIFKGRVEQISWAGKFVRIHAGDFSGCVEIRFRHLVMALGATVDLRRIPGMPEHSFLIQNVGDAMLLRSTIMSRLEEANLESRAEVKRRLLTFVVVGGGYSGVETAGQIADLFKGIHGLFPNISEKDLLVYLVHGREYLLPTLSQNLGEYSARKLSERGVRLLLSQRVKAVTASRVFLQDGSTIESHTVISTVGNAPHPLVIEMAGQCAAETESGRLITDETCQVKGIPNLWAAGDCAAVPHPEAGYCPANAQFAMRQGTHLGRNIERLLQGEDLLPFRFKGLGEMASIGHRSAVAEIMGVTFSGFFAWWLWRTVYLMKLPRFDRKLRVMLDWTLELFFPRDINLLNPRFSTRLQEVYLEPGDLLCRQGEPAFSFYIVQNGCIHLTDDQGMVRVVGAGDYFGERALLGDGVWQFDATASEPSTLVPVPASIFHQIVRGSGSLGRLFQRSAGKYHSRQAIQRIAGKIHNGTGPRTAGEWMTTQVHTLRPDDRLHDAFSLARRHPHSSYPVIDADRQILGAIHREDLLELLKQPEAPLDRPLSAFPISTLPIVLPDTRADELVDRLVRAGASKLLVADAENRLQGIVTVMDLIHVADSRPLSESSDSS